MKARKGDEEENRSHSARQPKRADGKSSSDLLMKRFEKDLLEVLQQFEIELDAEISEVTMTTIMAHMGFVQTSSNADLEAVQSIWQHLQPVVGASPSHQNENDEEEDNGERIVVAHLNKFMAAILGFQIG